MKLSTKVGIGIGAVCLAGALCFGYNWYKNKYSENLIKTEQYSVFDDETIASGSFNIQIFGEKKRENDSVMDILTDIGSTLDILAIQELKGNADVTLENYTQRLNLKTGKNYSYITSEPVGRSKNKERYAFVFSKDKIIYENISYTYADADNNFERPPFIAKFSSGKFTFTMVNIHTKPADAGNEISALEKVVRDAEAKTHEKDIITEGDFNADTPYFSESTSTGFRDTTKYIWVIKDYMNTTRTRKTYDRIVLTPSAREDLASVGKVFDFDSSFHLSKEFAKKVSDHFIVYTYFYRYHDTDK